MTDSIQTISYKELELGEKLGEGGFGVVYKGSWSGESVAVKTLRMTKLSSPLQEEFTREATAMAKLNNPRIIHLFGICIEPNHYAMIMAFMPKGDLYGLLSEPKRTLSWPKRWELGIDIGIGLSYLHKNQIIHRDLKSLNILLDRDERAKITDFGLATLRQQAKSIYTDKVRGSLPWMAPELANRKPKITKKADVYAYGMVLWEIASRKIPFSDAQDPSLILHWVKDGEREDIPKNCPKPFAEVIQHCWKMNPENRPTALNAKVALEKGYSQSCPKSIENIPTPPTSNPKPTQALSDQKGVAPLQDTKAPSLDASNWNCILTAKGHERIVNAITYLGGKLFASGSRDKTIKIWNISGQCLHTLKGGWFKDGHRDWVTSLAHLGGALFASGSLDKTIKIWNTSGHHLCTFKKLKFKVWALAHLGGDLFASGSWKTIKIWNTSGKCLRTLQGHSHWVFVLARLSNDLFASGSGDGKIKVWNTSGKCLHTLQGHSKSVSSLAYLGNDLLASGSEDHTMKIWNIRSGECLHAPKEEFFFGRSSLTYLGDNLFASGSRDGALKILNTSGQCLQTLKGHDGCCIQTVTHFEGNLFASSADDKTIKIWSKK